ncbi:MAG TPA: plasmid stabilization protein, partial [Firmicutes bacterium]|nr:plasmid stabilization protein [Bacillota bacterium]
ELAYNPTLGTPLSGNLSHLNKLEVRYRTIEYRIVYKIVRERIEIHVIHIGTRENFYSELRRRL